MSEEHIRERDISRLGIKRGGMDDRIGSDFSYVFEHASHRCVTQSWIKRNGRERIQKMCESKEKERERERVNSML